MKISLLLSVILMISWVFLSAYHYLLTSPYMKLEKVTLLGDGPEIGDGLLKMCGLESDVSLLALNLNELKQKMESHLWVRSVRLERKFPHTLIVQVEKEVPEALVVMDRIYYMNRRGEIFKELQDLDETDFPVITGISKQGANIRERLGLATVVMEALESKEGPFSLNELSEIHIREEGGASLYFNPFRTEIKLRCKDLESEVNGLNRVAEHLIRTGRIHQATAIDLNYMDGAVVSFREG